MKAVNTHMIRLYANQEASKLNDNKKKKLLKLAQLHKSFSSCNST